MFCISQCSYQFDWYQSDYNQNICNLKSWQWFSIVKLSYMNETVSSIILQNDLHYLINLKVHIFPFLKVRGENLTLSCAIIDIK